MEVAIREEVRVSAAAMAGTGRSFPLGATLIEGGANFSVFSRTADCIELLLFDREDDIRPSRVIRMDPCENRTYHYWHVFVPGLKAGQIYGFRASGPYDPVQGLRFDPSKVLLDPYGRAIAVPRSYDREAARHAGDNTADRHEKCGCGSYGRMTGRETLPCIGRGRAPSFTKRTCAALPHIPVPACRHRNAAHTPALWRRFRYLQQLGITAVELLPVFQFDPQDAPRGRTNYWGYSPVSFFAPHHGVQFLARGHWLRWMNFETW